MNCLFHFTPQTLKFSLFCLCLSSVIGVPGSSRSPGDSPGFKRTMGTKHRGWYSLVTVGKFRISSNSWLNSLEYLISWRKQSLSIKRIFPHLTLILSELGLFMQVNTQCRARVIWYKRVSHSDLSDRFINSLVITKVCPFLWVQSCTCRIMLNAFASSGNNWLII